MSPIKNESTEKLFKAILNLSSIDECYDFFDDLCTIKELMDMSQRFETAILLLEGKSYQQIAAEIGVSTATTGRVAKCLNYGSGGYQKAIASLENSDE